MIEITILADAVQREGIYVNDRSHISTFERSSVARKTPARTREREGATKRHHLWVKHKSHDLLACVPVKRRCLA